LYRILIMTLAATLWLTGLEAPTAQAQTEQTDRAGALVERGLVFARKGEFRKAAALFEEAVKLNPDPTILHSLARAREEMGEHALAFETFRQALELDPQYIYAQDARDRIAFLERLLKSTHALLRVSSTPGAADVRITTSEGAEKSQLITPFSYWAPAGSVTIEGTKDGFVDTSKTLIVAAGAETAVELVLRPVARKGFLVISVSKGGARVEINGKIVGTTPLAPMAIEAGPLTIRVEADGEGTVTREVLVVADKESQVVIDFNDPDAGARARSTGPWGPVLLGSGAMALVGGLVMHLSAVSLAEDARAKSAYAESLDEQEKTAFERAKAEYIELRDDAHANETVAYIGYGVSAALIGAGAFMLTSPNRTANADLVTDDDALSWTPVLVPSAHGFFAGTRVSF